jgi:hypothetical protein
VTDHDEAADADHYEEVDDANAHAGYSVIEKWQRIGEACEGVTAIKNRRGKIVGYKAQIYYSGDPKAHCLWVHRRQWVAKLFHDVAQLRLAENASYDLELLKDFVIKELAMEKYSHLMAGIDL